MITSPLAAQSYLKARPATEAGSPDARSSGALPGGLAAAGASFVSTLQAGEETARAALTGGADSHALVQALAASQLAVETAVTLRDKVVEAYQEILRMPV